MSCFDRIIRKKNKKKKNASAESFPCRHQSYSSFSPCPPCTSVSPHPIQSITGSPHPPLPGSSHRHTTTPLFATCCVSGKSSIRAQHCLGTAESWSPSSPSTSTKRQLSPTPSLVIIWNRQEIHAHLNRCHTTETTGATPVNDPFRVCLKMLRCVGPVRPHPSAQTLGAVLGRMLLLIKKR